MQHTTRVPFSRRRLGGPHILTGRGGAPKFLKNWLTFARSPYDADHIFRDFVLPPTPAGGVSMARPFPPLTVKLGDI